MFVLAALSSGELAFFEFGRPLDPEPDPRTHVLWILERYEERRAAFFDRLGPWGQTLHALLAEPASEARLAATIRALGFLGDLDAPSPLTRYLAHPARDVRAATIEAIGRIGEAELERLEPFVRDPDPVLRRAAILALGRTHDETGLAELERAAAGDPALAAALSGYRARLRAVEAGDGRGLLRAMLASAEYEDVLPMAGYVWEQLGAIAVDAAESERVRERALWAVTLPCIGKVRREIAEILDDPTAPEGLRQLATVGAGRCRARRALRRLIERAAGDDRDVGRAAITSLGQLGSPRALNPLLAMWADADAETRRELRLALRRLCHASGARLLEEWLEGAARPAARLYAIDDALGLDVDLRSERIRPLLADPDPGARRDAVLLLTWLGASGAAAALEPLAESDPDEELRRLALLARDRLRAEASRSG